MDDTERGLYGKFLIEKADGAPLHPRARYLVLNYGLDDDGLPFDKDARYAVRRYAWAVRAHNPQFADDLEAALGPEPTDA